MSEYVESVYQDARKVRYFQRLAKAKGVPGPFIDDAVQDIIVSLWVRCPEGRGWWQQSIWAASRAAERYGRLQRTSRRIQGDEEERVTMTAWTEAIEELENIPEEQWWIVDKVLDFRASISTLSSKELKAVEAAANSEQGSKTVGHSMSSAVKQNLRRARGKLSSAMK